MELSLAEQLLLLSYDDVTGKPAIPMSNLDHGLAAAQLLDLHYQGKLTLDHGRLAAVDRADTDPVLAKIRAHKPHTPDWWVYHLADPHRRERLLDRLIDAGMLERREHRILGMFPVRAYPEVDPTEERALVDHLRDVVTGQAEPDRRSLGLLALAHGCGLDRHLFPTLDATLVRHRLNELTQGDWCGQAVRKVVEAENVAMLAAVSGGIVASTAGAVAGT
ncbi:hypothetical protein Rhe02_21820 [Rhizocola hellebori]|uniref:GPP34 family phosphoprotein n=1 Tax=Rhizocola hellebori TaxID=1392758 RepID=A0A8J3Q6M7_9ACTN|nr:GPP34 family phosphoprotein [Rhizocola hellebori]GIH04115.1 hypothetical protein Rhe02_21820 [Rhizocola hellebori]